MSSAKPIQQVLESHRDALMQMPGVVGVAAGLASSGSRETCVLVYMTSEKRPEALPRVLDGYRVEVVVRKRGFRAFTP